MYHINMDKGQPVKIEISAKTVVFSVIFLLSLRFLWDMKDLFFSLFIAFIVMSAAKQPVSYLEKKKIPRGIGVVFVFFLFFLLFVFLASWVVPPLVYETTLFYKHWPTVVKNATSQFPWLFKGVNIPQYVPNITNQFLLAIRLLFSNAIFLISTIFFSVYLTLDDMLVEKLLIRFVDERHARRVGEVLRKIERRLGAWLTGEFLLMTVVGVLTFIGLQLLGIRYALPLAIIAGLLEAVPNVGPTIAGIPTVLVGFSQSPFLGVSALALAFVVQQLENNFIVPFVMRKVVGLHPIITLIALIIGSRYGGVLGVLLAIPLTLVIETLFSELSQKNVGN